MKNHQNSPKITIFTGFCKKSPKITKNHKKHQKSSKIIIFTSLLQKIAKSHQKFNTNSTFRNSTQIQHKFNIFRFAENLGRHKFNILFSAETNRKLKFNTNSTQIQHFEIQHKFNTNSTHQVSEFLVIFGKNRQKSPKITIFTSFCQKSQKNHKKSPKIPLSASTLAPQPRKL